MIPDKSFFMLFGIKDEVETELVSNKITIKISKEEKLLGITFDNELYFSKHLTTYLTHLIKLNTLD